MNSYGSHRSLSLCLRLFIASLLVAGSVGPATPAYAFELILRWTIPLPIYPNQKLETPPPAPAPETPFVILERDAHVRSISQAFSVTETPIGQMPGDSAIRASLRSGTFYTAHCECLVQTRDRTNRYDFAGESFARGLSPEMATRLTQESCFNYVRNYNQQAPSSRRIDNYTMGRCEQTAEQLPENLRQNLTTALDAIEAEQQSQARFEQLAIPRLILRVALSGIAGGFMWRSRGGGIQLGSTQLARLTFVGLGYSLIGLLNGVIENDPQLARDGAIAGLLMLPGSFLGYGTDFDLTKGDQQAKTLALAANGLSRVALPAIYLAQQGYQAAPLILGGTLMGACYNSAANIFERMRNHSRFFDGHTAVGESCTGAAFATGLAMSLAAQNRVQLHAASLPEDLESFLIQYKVAGNQQVPSYKVISTNVGPGAVRPQPSPAPSRLPEIENVCQQFKDRPEAFAVGGTANRQLAQLANNNSRVRQALCEPIKSLNRFHEEDRELSCFDFENVVANHVAKICGR